MIECLCRMLPASLFLVLRYTNTFEKRGPFSGFKVFSGPLLAIINKYGVAISQWTWSPKLKLFMENFDITETSLFTERLSFNLLSDGGIFSCGILDPQRFHGLSKFMLNVSCGQNILTSESRITILYLFLQLRILCIFRWILQTGYSPWRRRMNQC